MGVQKHTCITAAIQSPVKLSLISYDGVKICHARYAREHEELRMMEFIDRYRDSTHWSRAQ